VISYTTGAVCYAVPGCVTQPLLTHVHCRSCYLRCTFVAVAFSTLPGWISAVPACCLPLRWRLRSRLPFVTRFAFVRSLIRFDLLPFSRSHVRSFDFPFRCLPVRTFTLRSCLPFAGRFVVRRHVRLRSDYLPPSTHLLLFTFVPFRILPRLRFTLFTFHYCVTRILPLPLRSAFCRDSARVTFACVVTFTYGLITVGSAVLLQLPRYTVTARSLPWLCVTTFPCVLRLLPLRIVTVWFLTCRPYRITRTVTRRCTHPHC